jgi:DUF4097 and DUF4098 domain-containing protein YvlB
LGKNVGIWL